MARSEAWRPRGTNLDAISAGTLSFTQGGAPSAGTFKGKFRSVDGSVFVVRGVGNSGAAWDQPSAQSNSGSFTQTATKVTIKIAGGGRQMAH